MEIFFCLATVCAIVFRRQWADYWALGTFLSLHFAFGAVFVLLQSMADNNRLYWLYFYSYWFSYAIESILLLMVVYGIFRLAMAPLRGLQTLGMLVFRWAAVISVLLALGSAMSPGVKGTQYLIAAIQKLQSTQSILTLCLLLFVCFAVRPMGLSYRSRIFGVPLGLGMMSTTNLVQAAWIATNQQMYAGYGVVNGIAMCLTLAIWAAYFMLPEPKQRIIVLPTTSPFLRWNQISLALGDNPGFVAVGGITPDVFAPAELEIMQRASGKIGAQSALPPPAAFPKSISRISHVG